MAKSPIASSVLSEIPVLRTVDEITRAINGIRALVAYLEGRGIPRERLTDMLEIAERENRDLTNSEVAEMFGAAQDSIDRLREAAVGLPPEEPTASPADNGPGANEEGSQDPEEHPGGG